MGTIIHENIAESKIEWFLKWKSTCWFSEFYVEFNINIVFINKVKFVYRLNSNEFLTCTLFNFVTSPLWRKHDLKPFRNEPTTTFNNGFTCNIYIKMLKKSSARQHFWQSYIKVMSYIMNLFLLHLIVSFLGHIISSLIVIYCFFSCLFF